MTDSRGGSQEETNDSSPTRFKTSQDKYQYVSKDDSLLLAR